MRLVLDTNIVVSGLLWGGSPGRLLKLADEQKIELFSSLAVLEELDQVLSREHFAVRVKATGNSVAQLLINYAQNVRLIEPAFVRGISPDPDDDVVIATAIASKADLLVTGDKALLSVREYDGGRIVSVTEALTAVLPAEAR